MGRGKYPLKQSKGGPKWLSRSAESNLRCENEQEGELLDLAVAEDDSVGVKCIYGLTH